MKVKFLKSASKESEAPPGDRLEIALAGRSNAGKSSFLNALVQQNIAKTSAAPGKTTLLNFFDVGDHYRLVDMPGYGYSSRSGKEQMSWRNMIEGYLYHRPNLVGVILVIDSRRDWDEDERLLKKWLRDINCPLILVLTKADKLKKSEIEPIVAKMKKTSRVDDIFMTSSVTRAGIEELEEYMFEKWVKPHLKSGKRSD